MACASPFLAVEDVFEGSGKTYITRGNDTGYLLVVKSISDRQGSAIFDINGEITRPLKAYESYYLKDGSLIIPTQMIMEEGGPDLVHYYFSATDNAPMNLSIQGPLTTETDEGEMEVELNASDAMQEPVSEQDLKRMIDDESRLQPVPDVSSEVSLEPKPWYSRLWAWLAGLIMGE